MGQKVKWVWIIAIMALAGVRCGGGAVPTAVVAPSEEKEEPITATATSLPSPTIPENAIPVIGFEGSQTARVGEQVLLVVKIWGSEPIGELDLKIKISMDSLSIHTPEGESNQVLLPQGFPEEAEIRRNEVDEKGILHYQVLGLGDSLIPTGELLIIPLVPVHVGIGMVEPLEARVITTEGSLIPVQIASAWLLDIQDGSATISPSAKASFFPPSSW